MSANAALVLKIIDIVELGFRSEEIRNRVTGKTDSEVSAELDAMLVEADQVAQAKIDAARNAGV